jgi:hypothetical protein
VSDANARYRLPETVLRARLESSDVLLNTRSGLYHLLSGTGPDIVEALQDGATIEAVVTTIAGRTDGELARVQADVTAFVASLVGQGLLEPVP